MPQTAQLITLLDAFPSAVALSTGGTVVYTNPAHVALLGYTTEAFAAMALRDYLHPSDLALARARFDRARRGERNHPSELRMRHANGELRVVEVTSVLLTDDVVATVSVDRTEVYQVREGVAQHARLASFGDLAANVAQELNRPLRGLVQDLAALRSDLAMLAATVPALSERLTALEPRLDSARRSAARLASLTEDLEAYAQGGEHSSMPHNLRDILESAVELAWPRLRKADIGIFRDFTPTPLVMANEARLVQLFLNLLDNAGDALEQIPAGRRLDLGLHHEADGDQVVVTLCDNGGGVTNEALPRLAEPFYSTRPGARGMGLSISHSIAHTLGGSLRVLPNATAGVTAGVTVVVKLPAWYDEFVVEDSLDGVEPRILLIDDEPLVLRTFERMLSVKGSVVAVGGGREAADLLRRDQDWDLILCDLMMPEIGGNDLYEMVQEHWPELTERWIVITGGAFTGSAADFLRATAVPVLEKPIDQAALFGLVDNILRRRNRSF